MDDVGNGISYSWTEKEDIRGILTLFNAGAPQYSRSVAYWHWSNTDVPFGKSLSVVAKSGGWVVAHYSIMPWEFWVQGKPTTIGFGLQAVVQKEFRNFKIMKTLTDLVFEKAKEKFPFVYAFPNDDFFLVKKRLLGWQEVGAFCADVIPLKNLNGQGKNGIEIRELDFFPVMSWLGKNGSGISVRKNTNYLNWRFIGHPIHHYILLGAFHHNECVGYLVLKLYFKQEENVTVGHFVDFDAKGKDWAVLSSLVAAAKEFFQFYGMEKIIFWNQDKSFEKFFKDFITGQAFKTNFGVLVGDKNLESFALNKENWSFTMAVSDAF